MKLQEDLERTWNDRRRRKFAVLWVVGNAGCGELVWRWTMADALAFPNDTHF